MPDLPKPDGSCPDVTHRNLRGGKRGKSFEVWATQIPRITNSDISSGLCQENATKTATTTTTSTTSTKPTTSKNVIIACRSLEFPIRSSVAYRISRHRFSSHGQPLNTSIFTLSSNLSPTAAMALRVSGSDCMPPQLTRSVARRLTR